MFTLKIRTTRTTWEPSDTPGNPERVGRETVTSTKFIPADSVEVCDRVHGDNVLAEYDRVFNQLRTEAEVNPDLVLHLEASFTDNPFPETKDAAAGGSFNGSRWVIATHNGERQWFLVSQAWLLGPNGDTIERIAP